VQKGEYVKQVVQQATAYLPYFHYEIPMLLLADGAIYIPVRVLCEMLGLRADRHIPKWRKLIFWQSAHKLPLHTATKGTWIVWCIPIEEYPFVFVCFDWRLVSSERRIQLRHAVDAWSEASGQAFQKMQIHYKHQRHLLFTFFTTFADSDVLLKRLADLSRQSLDFEAASQLDILVHQGKSILLLASAHARKLLQDQVENPTVDVATIPLKGTSVETVSLPLLPVVPRGDSEQFTQHLEKLTAWLLNLTDFLDEHELRHDEK
jgi:hypothetical protein